MTKIVYFCIRILVIKTVCFCVRILVIKTVYYWYLILSSAASLSVDTNHRTFLASPPFFLKWRWSPGYGTSCNKMTGRWCIWVVTLCFILFFTLVRPAIVVLLMSMVNERQPFVLRCAVLYCFQCFLYKNQKGQGEIVATLLPSTIDGK